MSDDIVRAQLLSRINDPSDLPKFERLYDLTVKKLARKKIPQGDVMGVFDVTVACWKRVFGVEWPKTKA